MATTPPTICDDAEKNPDVLCPVLIHVHNPVIRERRRSIDHHTEKQHRRTIEDLSKKWIDLDENVLDDYILIDDGNLGPLVPEIDNEELPYPENFIEYVDDDDDDDNDDNNDDENDNDNEDTASHGGPEYLIYKQLRKNTSKRFWPDFDFGATYPLANSHGNAYQDSSSHSKYTELYSEFRNTRNNLDAVRDLDMMSYAVANSHGEHGDPMTNIRNRDYRESSESDNFAWDGRPIGANYEMANSHSNYRVFYDSQTQHQPSVPHWSPELWRENRRRESHVTSDSIAKRDDEECETNTNRSRKKNEQESETNCDIEQCLVQIEESLLNIEQNLLHVQDLDIPELRNLLYKSPSIERSLYEVQDLFYADGIVPVIARSKSMSVNSDEEEEEEDEEEVEEEEVWAGQHITIKDNDNEDCNASTSFLNGSNDESSDITKQNLSKSIDDHHYINWIDESNLMQKGTMNSGDQIDSEKAMNFVPNSLSKTPRRIVFDEVKENIRLYSSKSEESAITIDYNLNSTYGEKKSLFRDKWHSRTNSLDENSILQNLELIDNQENGKSSLQNIFLEFTESRHLTANVKARSEGALQTDAKKCHNRRGSHEERLLQAVEATTEDFRKKLESFTSQRRSILDNKQRKMMPRSIDTSVSRSREKSPMKSKCAITTAAKNQDKENGVGKNIACDKRKRKKTSGKNQSTSENALEPSKLISLSLSLLLAALLQAVRCLTDLVEDAFRSISYDRNGLLQ